jgi:hypothetical protein
VGLNALERALEKIGDDIEVELHFQPFELNPTLAPEGEDTVQYLSKKYGISAEQMALTPSAIATPILAVMAPDFIPVTWYREPEAWADNSSMETIAASMPATADILAMPTQPHSAGDDAYAYETEIPAIKGWAERQGQNWWDSYSLFPAVASSIAQGLVGGDGVHPTVAGYRYRASGFLRDVWSSVMSGATNAQVKIGGAGFTFDPHSGPVSANQKER